MAHEKSFEHPFTPLLDTLRAALNLKDDGLANEFCYHIPFPFVPDRDIAGDARAERSEEHVRLWFSRDKTFDYAHFDVYRYRHRIAKASLQVAAARAPDKSYMLWAKLGNTKRHRFVLAGIELDDLLPTLRANVHRSEESALCRAVLDDLVGLGGSINHIWKITVMR